MEDVPNNGDDTVLPKRDLFVIPLIVLLTLACLLGASELLAQYFYPTQPLDTCQIPDDTMGTRFKPDCTSTTKLPKGRGSRTITTTAASGLRPLVRPSLKGHCASWPLVRP